MKREIRIRAILKKEPQDLCKEEREFLRESAQFLSREECQKFFSILQRRELSVAERASLRKLFLLDRLFPRPADWTQEDEDREIAEDSETPTERVQ
jgi:hypothetical protein